jgi:hypothetical protein
MPQISAVTINDGTATPVAYTFSPIGKDAKGVFWFTQTTPNPANTLGAYKLGYSQTPVMGSGKQLNGNVRAVYTLHMPTLETVGTADNGITPPPTVAYKEVARIELEVAERSALAERKNLRVFASNLMASAMVTANIDTLQPSYS